jgi:hypothetical protein
MMAHDTARHFDSHWPIVERIEDKLAITRDERDDVFFRDLFSTRFRGHYAGKTSSNYENPCHFVTRSGTIISLLGARTSPSALSEANNSS